MLLLGIESVGKTLMASLLGALVGIMMVAVFGIMGGGEGFRGFYSVMMRFSFPTIVVFMSAAGAFSAVVNRESRANIVSAIAGGIAGAIEGGALSIFFSIFYRNSISPYVHLSREGFGYLIILTLSACLAGGIAGVLSIRAYTR